ncbi:MAG: DMT family transporter [Solirubrobacteraceae bacterium]|nr:DMT family transporter [Solirubrobacteraceae bacterium]
MKFDMDRTNEPGVTPVAAVERRRAADAGFSITAALAWGLMFPIAAGVIERIDAFNLTALRYLGASPLLLLLLWKVEGRQALRYEGRFLRLFWLGTLGFAGFNLLAYVALTYTEPQNAALIVALAPLVTVGLRWLRDGIRPAPGVLAFILLALLGVAMVLGQGDPLSIAAHANVGDLLVLGGVVGWVLYTLGAAGHAELSPLRYTALTAPAGTISIVAITAVSDAAGWTTLPSLGDVGAEWLPILYVIVFGALVAVLSWNEGVRRLGPSTGSLFMNLVPVTSFAVAIGQGYDPAAGELAGAVLTILAIIGANRVAARAAAAATVEAAAAGPRVRSAPTT